MTPSRADACPQDAPTAIVFLPWTRGAAVTATLRTLLASTDSSLPVFLPAQAAAELVQMPGLPADRLRPITVGDGETPGALLDAVTELSPGADLVLVADAVQLSGDWLSALQAVAAGDDALAAVTAVVTESGDPLVGEPAVSPAEARVGLPEGTPATHPWVLVPWPHCVLVRRQALGLTQGFDHAYAHPAAVLADFGARALAHGLSCAVAEEVCLKRAEERLGPCPAGDQERLRSEHPWLAPAASEQAELHPGPLRRSLVAARTATGTISVTVDARALGLGVGGTQTYVAALVLALARSPVLSVRAVVADHAAPDTLAAFRSAGVELVTPEQAEAGIAPTDVVHRPQQAFSASDLRLLQKVGDRLVISQMDLILYRNPGYHASPQGWADYRRATRLALAIADETVFFSEHTQTEAFAEDLVDPARTSIAGIGVERELEVDDVRRPERVPREDDLLVVLGSDYTHKNRPFALALGEQLRRRHGWDGWLVLAGPHQTHGSSAAAERRLLSDSPELAARVVDLGPVSDAERRWLLSAAAAHICASSHEGFGLVPLEAAAAGRPCIYAPCTSLAEIIDPEAAAIVPWDVAASADQAAALLREGDARSRHLALLGEALTRYTWNNVVERLVEAYRRAIASPYRGATPLAWEAIRHEEERRDLQDRVRYGQLLIDRRGGLLSQAQQRGLMRVASRRWLRGPLLAPFELLGIDERATPRAPSQGNPRLKHRPGNIGDDERVRPTRRGREPQ